MIRKLNAAILAIVTMVALMATNTYAEDIMDILKDGYEITITTPGTNAGLCPRPMCGMNESIAKIWKPYFKENLGVPPEGHVRY